MKKSWIPYLGCAMMLGTTNLMAMHNGDNTPQERPSIPMPRARVLDLDREREVEEYFQRLATQASQPEPQKEKSEDGQQQ